MVINCTKDLHMHVHLIKFSTYLKRKFTIEPTDSVGLKLLSYAVYSLTKYLHLWLSKILLNFAGTSYQLHFQSLHSSVLCRCCILKEEIDTFHSLYCKHSLFIDFKQDLIIKLQEDACWLPEGDIVTCLLL